MKFPTSGSAGSPTTLCKCCSNISVLCGSLSQLDFLPMMAVFAAPVSSAAMRGPQVQRFSYFVDATYRRAACLNSSQVAASPDHPGTPSLVLVTVISRALSLQDTHTLDVQEDHTLGHYDQAKGLRYLAGLVEVGRRSETALFHHYCTMRCNISGWCNLRT